MGTDEELLPFLAVTDATPLAQLVRSVGSAESLSLLFDPLRISSGTFYVTIGSALDKILALALPPTFFNDLACCAGAAPTAPLDEYASPAQIVVLTILKQILVASKSNENFGDLLRFLAISLIPRFPPSPHAIRLCGIARPKHLGVLALDGTVTLYPISSPTSPVGQVSLYAIVADQIEWEMSKAELETGLFIESQSIFRTFECCVTAPRLPDDVYAAMLAFITAPDQPFISAVLAQSLSDIDSPLVTVFSYAGAHRLLLKHCVYEEAKSCSDAGQIMRRNTSRVRIALEFVRQQIRAVIPIVNRLKGKLTAAPPFDFASASDANIAIIRETLEHILDAILEIVSVLPSSVRFVCRCVDDAVAFFHRDPALGRRGVFMFFIFRIIFPILTQPQETDPPDLVVDPIQMAKYPKLLTNIFVAERQLEPALAGLAIEQRARIDAFYERLERCPEMCDVVAQPTYAALTAALDVIRTKCAPMARELAFAPPRELAVMRAWLERIE